MAEIFKTLVVPAFIVEVAREVAAALSNGGIGMFVCGLSSVEGPATHYYSTGMINAQFAALLTNGALLFSTATWLASVRGMPMTATLAQCEQLVSVAIVSDQSMTAIAEANGWHRLPDETEV